MKLHFLAPRTFKSHCCTYPLRAFKKQLLECGIHFQVFHRISKPLENCDVLCVLATFFGKSQFHQNPPDMLRTLQKFRDRYKKIILFDVSDSTGTTFFHAMPYIDLYAKNQLLRDTSRYREPFYGLRPYTDYYHSQAGVIDPQEETRISLEAGDENKLVVSWNLGLGNWFGWHRQFRNFGRRITLFVSSSNYDSVKHTAWNETDRVIDAVFRGRMTYNRPSVNYQRQKTSRLLQDLSNRSTYNIIFEGKVPYQDYRKEMQSSKIVLSPFGLGEINAGRDFESFVDGAVLFKPDMSHLQTWPDYYLPEETYIPHRWDFLDFEDRLSGLLENPEQLRKISVMGQERYLDSLSAAGGEHFSRHLASLLERLFAPQQPQP